MDSSPVDALLVVQKGDATAPEAEPSVEPSFVRELFAELSAEHIQREEARRAYVLVPTNRDRALVAARERFAVEIVAKRALFFETLLVLRLSHRR